MKTTTIEDMKNHYIYQGIMSMDGDICLLVDFVEQESFMRLFLLAAFSMVMCPSCDDVISITRISLRVFL